VYLPAKPPEPARELACVLEVGQRAGPVEVLGIDEVAGSVRLKNAGVERVLMLEKAGPHVPSAPLPKPPPPPIQVISRR
jgi:hypothetical protein